RGVPGAHPPQRQNLSRETSCMGEQTTALEQEASPAQPDAGGLRELLRLALPLIFSSSFMTVQVTIDRVFLSKYDADAVSAVIPSVMVFWSTFILLQATANFATTFVAQYVGTRRPGPRRAGDRPSRAVP